MTMKHTWTKHHPHFRLWLECCCCFENDDCVVTMPVVFVVWWMMIFCCWIVVVFPSMRMLFDWIYFLFQWVPWLFFACIFWVPWFVQYRRGVFVCQERVRHNRVNWPVWSTGRVYSLTNAWPVHRVEHVHCSWSKATSTFPKLQSSDFRTVSLWWMMVVWQLHRSFRLLYKRHYIGIEKNYNNYNQKRRRMKRNKHVSEWMNESLSFSRTKHITPHIPCDFHGRTQ